MPRAATAAIPTVPHSEKPFPSRFRIPAKGFMREVCDGLATECGWDAVEAGPKIDCISSRTRTCAVRPRGASSGLAVPLSTPSFTAKLLSDPTLKPLSNRTRKAIANSETRWGRVGSVSAAQTVASGTMPGAVKRAQTRDGMVIPR
ncbi:hypothetical protein ACFB49_00640 [Sphingomonas sp. DBB INV C78]